MHSYSVTNKPGKSAGSRSLLIGLLVVWILQGCAQSPTIETKHIKAECIAPVMTEPAGFSWDSLTDVPISISGDVDDETYHSLQGYIDDGTLSASVPVPVLIEVDETVQTLIDQVLDRQAMLEGLCG